MLNIIFTCLKFKCNCATSILSGSFKYRVINAVIKVSIRYYKKIFKGQRTPSTCQRRVTAEVRLQLNLSQSFIHLIHSFNGSEPGEESIEG